uniref:Uncharacterized protein n=1 Tax=Malurus cyaneus samueli TaxID=2593467 RepID=A0A8C5X7N6_9PASS
MMDDNKQLALRIDGRSAAGQEVTALRAELAATGRRLAELGSDPPWSTARTALKVGPQFGTPGTHTPSAPHIPEKLSPSLGAGRGKRGAGGSGKRLCVKVKELRPISPGVLVVLSPG